MRARSIHLTKTCPVCGGRGAAEAKLAMSAHRKAPEFDLDDMAGLVEAHSLSLLLALVELLPYKQFACGRCDAEFKLESNATKPLVQAMLVSMQPVVPSGKPANAVGRSSAKAGVSTPAAQPRPEGEPGGRPRQKEWEEAESLDRLLDHPGRDRKSARL